MTFWIGTLAIAGIPPLAGFFSKDEILHAAAAEHQWLLWAVGLFTAGLTAFYMCRAFYMTFHGKFRGTHEQEHHLHESPAVMTIPLWILAVGAVVAGWLGIPKLLSFGRDLNWFHHFLEPVIARPQGLEAGEHGIATSGPRPRDRARGPHHRDRGGRHPLRALDLPAATTRWRRAGPGPPASPAAPPAAGEQVLRRRDLRPPDRPPAGRAVALLLEGGRRHRHRRLDQRRRLADRADRRRRPLQHHRQRAQLRALLLPRRDRCSSAGSSSERTDHGYSLRAAPRQHADPPGLLPGGRLPAAALLPAERRRRRSRSTP